MVSQPSTGRLLDGVACTDFHTVRNSTWRMRASTRKRSFAPSARQQHAHDGLREELARGGDGTARAAAARRPRRYKMATIRAMIVVKTPRGSEKSVQGARYSAGPD